MARKKPKEVEKKRKVKKVENSERKLTENKVTEKKRVNRALQARRAAQKPAREVARKPDANERPAQNWDKDASYGKKPSY